MKLAENVFLAVSLAAMVVLPLLEALLRSAFRTGIPGQADMVSYLTLMVGTIGAAVAARENRLLALSTLGGRLQGRLGAASTVFSSAVTAVVSGSLALASFRVVQVDRTFGRVLAFGVPIWIVKAVMPLGFVLIAWHALRHSAGTWSGRVAAMVVAVLVVPLWNSSPAFAFTALGVATLLGAPAFVTLGGLAMVLFQREGEPVSAISISHYSLVTNEILPTIPLFTLAGYFLAEGGAPKRLVSVFQAVFGRLRGGAAIVTAMVCAFFTSFTGGSGVTIIALGGLLMPVLRSRRYSERSALGLVTGAGSLGLLFPPCLPLILYAIVAKVPMERMFLGGILPGTLLLVMTALWGVWAQDKRSVAEEPPFNRAAAWRALWVAKWELLIPVLALGGLFSGWTTPVEAAALTALYAFCCEALIYRDLNFKADVLRVLTECGLIVGGILLIQGVALGFTNYLVDAEMIARAAAWAAHTIHARWVFLLVLNLFLLLVGCLMEIYAAIVIQAPLLVAMAAPFGIDPVHLGIIFLANLELGYLTPPIGLNLLLSSYRFNKTVPEVLRASLPLVVVLGIGVLLITYVPALTTALPNLLEQ